MFGLLFGVSACLLTAAAAEGLENETFGVVPDPQEVNGTDRNSFEFPLDEGSTFEDAIRVYNRTEEVIELTVYAADAEAPDDGPVAVGARGTRPEGVASWLSLGADTVRLEPRGEEVVPFRISIRSSDPHPDLGAILVENTAGGSDSRIDGQRLLILVRTAPPGTQTGAVPVNEPARNTVWWGLGVATLLFAVLLVLYRRRRGRAQRDALLLPGELTDRRPADGAAPGEPLRPGDGDDDDRTHDEVLPLLGVNAGADADEPFAEPDTADDDEVRVPDAGSERAMPPKRRPRPKRNYIPLDEL